ncbi:MAG: hypothetical protein HOP11_09440 [Saprospiraceae bacterium]|nr:hypothetical protein [Saprospiraceae bacterium]
MAFIDKLKGIFIEVDDKAKKSSTVSNTNPTPNLNSQQKVTVQGQNLQKFVELLGGVMKKNNFPGYDYLEYKKALQSVAKLGNMEEGMMFKTVFAAAQSMNTDANMLIGTAKKYIDVLETEKVNFLQAADNYLTQTVKSKNDELAQLTQQLTSNKSKLEALQKEIAEQEVKLQSLQSESQEITNKVDSNKADFSQTFQSFVEEIKSDIQKMQQYLS